MPASRFWLMHAGIALGAGLVFLLVGRVFAQRLSPENIESEPAGPAA